MKDGRLFTRLIWYNWQMNAQHKHLLLTQQKAYKKLNAWEAKERLLKLPQLSIEDGLAQYFQLVLLSTMTANQQQVNQSSQIKRWQQRAQLIHALKN